MQKIIEDLAFSRESTEERALESLLHRLHSEYGFDFTVHKRPSVLRRVRRRVSAVGLTAVAEYREYVDSHPDELPKLFDMLLINVTAFFRDPEVWDALATVLPDVISRGGDRPIRVWSAGCSSGEEPYTLAIVLREWLGEAAFSRRVQIFATDVDEDVLELAHRAVYPTKSLASISPELVARHFVTHGETSAVSDELRRVVVFGRHDLVTDPPLQRVDVIACRNALMYFNSEAQGRILQKLQFSLNEHGILVLGKAEMLLSHSELFASVDAKMRLFTRAPAASRRKSAESNGVDGPRRLADAWTRAAFDAHASASLVVDAAGNTVLANRAARGVFSFRPEDIGRPVGELVKRMPVEAMLAAAQRAIRERRGVDVEAIEETLPSGAKAFVDVRVTPISSEDGQNGAQLTLVDSTRTRQVESELRRSRLELEGLQRAALAAETDGARALEELEYVTEKLQRTTAMLDATRDELAATNEELAATSEELATMNEELCRRGVDLHRANMLLGDVLGSLRTGVAVLDRELCVSICNTKMAALCQRPVSEVERRSLSELDVRLPMSEIASAARTCLESGDASVLTIDASRPCDDTIPCVVSIHPLRGVKPSGVIVLVEEVV